MDEETSNFIKRYKQILYFKSKATRKINKAININTDNSTDNNSNNNEENKKQLIILPYINNNRKIQSSQMKYNKSYVKKLNEKIPSSNRNINKKMKLNEITELNRKEYKQFIIEQSDMSPKKNVKVINNALYNRLLKKDRYDILLNNSADDSKINSSKENKDNNKISIKLPFLSNIKSRYLDYKDNSASKILLESDINKSSNPQEHKIIFKKSKSTYKKNDIIKKKEKYYYSMVYGNNCLLVEKCLLTRPNWEKIEESNSIYSCNLIWAPVSQQINFISHQEVHSSQLINHFEYHNQVSNKKDLFTNLLKYCEINKKDLFSFFPFTIVLCFNESFVNEQIEGFKRLYDDIPNLIEDKKEGLKKNYADYVGIDSLKRFGKTHNIILPKSFFKGKNMWLLKRTNLNRGREIKIYSDINEILNEIDSNKKNNNYNNLVIQKYLEDPFLYDNRKFDIRIWVLFTYLSNNTKLKVYVFKEGHLKACSEPYDINSNDLYVHLTNYSVQKYNKNFSKIEKGNEISFGTFQEKLDKIGDGKNFKRDVMPKIIKIISISANSAKSKINVLNKKNCFEIFGYDFILDSNFNPFLLEINTNPGLEESSPLIEMLVPRMIDDAFRLTIDQIFERSDENKNVSKFKVDGYSDEENMWENVDLNI